MRDVDDPGLPIKWNPCSNGEYAPFPTTPVVREAVRRARRDADANARRIGMSRRRFLRSSMGSATALLALQACSTEASESSESSPGGTFDLPPESTTEPTAAVEALGGDGSPVFDVQNHFLEFDLANGGSSFFGQSFPQADCSDVDDPRSCFDIDHWISEVFGRSDTTMAVLSAVPILGEPNPLSAALMRDAIARVGDVCDDRRVLMQGHAVPNVGDVDAALDAMADLRARFPVAAWKTYTHVGDPFLFDDSAGSGVGERFLSWVAANGPPVVAVHKGLSRRNPFASPADIGPAAVAHPDLSFVVYHSGFETPSDEAEYRPDGRGIDRLIRSVTDAGLGPGSNVYAELGSTWRTVMSDPTVAAHVLGKLLVHLGEDNVCWGTDAIWYGSPQDQIESLRAFQITPEFQERFGYPSLTDEIKAKIFWKNSARIYGVDPPGQGCDPESADGERQQALAPNRTWGPNGTIASRRQFLVDHPWLA